MRREFNNFFEIKNKDLYNINRESVDCFICKELIINPVMCKECGTLFCKTCIEESEKILLDTKKQVCPRKCPNFAVCVPNTYSKVLLDKIKLNCKFGCEVLLSDSYGHMESCIKSKMDINCWSCSKKSFSSNMKISKEKYDYLINLNNTRKQNDEKLSRDNLEEMNNDNKKIEGYNYLLHLDKAKKSLEVQVRDINKKIKAKETILLMLKKLKKNLTKGESLSQLQTCLKKKKSLLKSKIEEYDKYTKELNIKYNDENEIELNEDYVTKFKKFTLEGHKNEITCLIKLNKTTIISGSFDTNIKIWDLISGECKSTLGDVNHQYYIYCLEKINENHIASGNNNKTIEIWNLDSNKCSHVLNGHTGSVWSLLKMNDTTLISGSEDNSIKTWNLTTNTCIKTFKRHNGTVTSLVKLNEFKIASGSDDGLIKIWNLQDNQNNNLGFNDNLMKDLTDQEKEYERAIKRGDFVVRSNHFREGEKVNKKLHKYYNENYSEILFGFMDFKKIEDEEERERKEKLLKMQDQEEIELSKLMDIEDAIRRAKKKEKQDKENKENTSGKEGKRRMEFVNNILFNYNTNEFAINCLIKLNEKDLACGVRNDIKIFNIDTGMCINTLIGHRRVVTCVLKLNETQMASGSYKKIKIWDLQSRDCIKTLNGHTFGISCLVNISEKNKTIIVSGSYDKLIKIWEL